MELLARRMEVTLGQKFKADRARSRPLGSEPMAKGLSGVLRDKGPELASRTLMLLVSGPGPGKERGLLRPGIGGTHVNHSHQRELGPGRLSTEAMRDLSGRHTAPEDPLHLHQDVLVDRVS